jgi:hypothetical protein
MKPLLPVAARSSGLKTASRNFFASIVNWITFARAFPGHLASRRMAQANFNVRGWQGRWRHTAPTALFFLPSTVTHRTAIAVSLGSIPRQGLRDASAKAGRAERNKPGRVHCQIPTSSARQARPRMALAIGNGVYANVTALPNPSNAARDIADALRDHGFKVIEGYNLGSTAMSGKIEELAWRCRKPALYRAGHNVQVAGKNYLILYFKPGT